MLGLGLGILALFSLVGIFAGREDPRRGTDPRDDVMLWFLGRHR